MPLRIYLSLGLLIVTGICLSGCSNERSANTSITTQGESRNADTPFASQQPDKDVIAKGFVYAQKNDPKALKIADSLIHFGGKNDIIARGFYLKGIYFTNLNITEKAIACFDSAIINNYTFTEPYIEKGILLYELKKYDLAIDLLNKASQLDRYNPELYYWLAKNYDAKKNHEEALFYYEQTIILDPKFNGVKEAIEQINQNPKTTHK